MKKRIYIFLDVDGVLNNTDKWEKDYKKWGYVAGTYSMDEKNIQNLVKLHRKIKNKYDLHYVLSSSWRLNNDNCKIVFARLSENGIELEGAIDKDTSADRGNLILKYLNDKDYDLAVAFDDDSEDIIPYIFDKFQLIQTSTLKGFTRKEIRKFKKLLKERF